MDFQWLMTNVTHIADLPIMHAQIPLLTMKVLPTDPRFPPLFNASTWIG